MKAFFLSVFIFCSYVCFCQLSNSGQIDSAVQKILSKRDSYYVAGVNHFDNGKDSNVKRGSITQYYYSDNKGKNLVYVNVLSFSGDTTSIHFFYNDKKLIKIDAYSFNGTRKLHDEYYFKAGKLCCSAVQGKTYFSNPNDLKEQAEVFLKFKPKKLSGAKTIIH